MEMITTQLFEEIQGSKFGGSPRVRVDDDLIIYYTEDASVSVEIDNFFFICKKWAENRCYIISSYSSAGGLGFANLQGMNTENKVIKFEYKKSEHFAVFEACQYIIDNN